jgi:hypothetical protein
MVGLGLGRVELGQDVVNGFGLLELAGLLVGLGQGEIDLEVLGLSFLGLEEGGDGRVELPEFRPADPQAEVSGPGDGWGQGDEFLVGPRGLVELLEFLVGRPEVELDLLVGDVQGIRTDPIPKKASAREASSSVTFL